jgi:hypothetical protein
VEEVDSSLSASRRSLANPTKSKEEIDSRPLQGPDTFDDPPQEESMVNGLLRNSESASLISNHDGEATELGTGEAQTRGQPDEEHGISFFIGHHLGREDLGDGPQEAAEASGVGADKLRRSMRKRTWSEESSSLSHLQSFSHPLSGAQQRAVNRDISSSKGPPRPPEHKRSKIGE